MTAPLKGIATAWALFLVGNIFAFGFGLTDTVGAVIPAPLTPPPWVFVVVWGAIFTLHGAALGLLWAAPGRAARVTGWITLALIVNNAAYTLYAFADYGETRLYALMGNLLAVGLCAAATGMAALCLPRAAWLLAPMLLWVAFATVIVGQTIALNGLTG